MHCFGSQSTVHAPTSIGVGEQVAVEENRNRADWPEESHPLKKS